MFIVASADALGKAEGSIRVSNMAWHLELAGVVERGTCAEGLSRNLGDPTSSTDSSGTERRARSLPASRARARRVKERTRGTAVVGPINDHKKTAQGELGSRSSP